MTVNGSSPPVTRGALQSKMSKASLKRCVLRQMLNLVVTYIDLSSFGKLFHEAGPTYEKARSSILWLMVGSSQLVLADLRSRLRLASHAVGVRISYMLPGLHSVCTLWIIRHNLYTMRNRIGRQCSSRRDLVRWSRGPRPQTRRTAVFWTRGSGAMVDFGRPLKNRVTVVKSTREESRNCAYFHYLLFYFEITAKMVCYLIKCIPLS